MLFTVQKSNFYIFCKYIDKENVALQSTYNMNQKSALTRNKNEARLIHPIFSQINFPS